MSFKFRLPALSAALLAVFWIPACNQQGAVSSTSQIEANRSGPWTLNPDKSGMSYVTIKNGNLGEINTFRSVKGSVSETGKAEITISLDSVDTNNEIRDERMKEHLFDTATYSTTKVTANLDMSKFETLNIGASHTVLLDMQIDLHGITDQQEFYVLVTRLGPNKVVVNNKAPLLLDATDFGFEDGLAKLQELAGLDSISPVVSATISFTFER